MKEKVKFGESLDINKVIFKICPNCRMDITQDMHSAYNDEWCPFCGLNHDVVFEDKEV